MIVLIRQWLSAGDNLLQVRFHEVGHDVHVPGEQAQHKMHQEDKTEAEVAAAAAAAA